MGHYDDQYAVDDERRHKEWLRRVAEKEKVLQQEINEKGLARVLAERWTAR